MQKQVIIRPGGTEKWQRDAGTNDSDKLYTVPTGKMWHLLSIEVGFAATATVGNRILQHTIDNGTDVVHAGEPTAAAAASSRSGYFVNNTERNASTRRWLNDVGYSTSPQGADVLPNPCLLPAGYRIHIWDAAAIDAAADDMVVVLHYVEYEA